MSVSIKPGHELKHFNAVCMVSRWNVAEVYARATAETASSFIDKLIKDSPFPIAKIQVDGGSEFMAEFEQACKKHQKGLAFLAPKSPKTYDLPTQLSDLRPF